MRQLIYIIFILALYISSQAQTKLQKGRFTINEKTINIDKIDMANGKALFCARILGEYENKHYPLPKNPNAFPVLISDIHIDTNLIKQTFLAALNNKLARAITADNNRVGLDITFAQNGKIQIITFYFEEGIKITTNDIVAIDNALKAKVKATFTGKDYLDYYFISYPSIYITFYCTST